jgi:hypothetical protein
MSLEKRVERLEKSFLPDDDGRITAIVMIPYGTIVSAEEIDLAVARAHAANPELPCVSVEFRQPATGGE